MTGITTDGKLLAGTSLLAIAMLAQLPVLHEPTLRIAVHQGVEGAPLKRIAERFGKTYRGSVQVVELPYDELFAAEMAATPHDNSHAGARFDVIQLDDPWLPALSKGLRPLDPQKLTQSDGIGIKDFPGSLWNVCSYPKGGPTYAVPFTGNSQLFCRRESAIPDPKDWGDLIPKTRPDSERLTFSMRLAPGNSLVTDFLPILWRYAPASFGEIEFCKLEPDAKKAFQTFRKLAGQQNWAGSVSKDVDVAASIALDAASSGIVWSAWAMALQRLPLGDQFLFTWLPGVNPELGAWLLAIPQNSENTREAEEFIRFAVSRDELKNAVKYGNPPPRISVLQDQDLLKDKTLALRSFPMQQWSLENARPRTRTPCWKQLETALGNYLAHFLAAPENASAKVLDDLNEEIGRIRKQEKRPPAVPSCPAE